MDDQGGKPAEPTGEAAPEAPEPSAPDSPAAWAFERIARQIREFESQLSEEEEIGLPLIGTKTGVMHIEDIGFWGPDMLIYHGTNDHRKPMRLLQHYTQMSILLTAVPKIKAEPNRIGFHLSGKMETAE